MGLLNDAERGGVVTGLHLLLARVHLHEAGVRRLTAEEEYLLYGLSRWYERREKPQAGSANDAYLCKCLEPECPHKHFDAQVTMINPKG